MATKMLIDASHPEETRVAVVDDERLEEFDFETSTKTQNKGNIYLARVSRVEPSLQAAFVDYGGNRQGFLAFNEIHPDYFQIPIGDRKAAGTQPEGAVTSADSGGTIVADQEEYAATELEPETSDDVAGADNHPEGSKRRERGYRSYRIQEVIKRRQVILVQVSKEERGNKGAAVSSYISLPGRYCVLMPNTLKGGGVSRKIESGDDRSRLRSIVSELDVPKGMGVIVRTAGQERNKAEIKRDFDYLLRLWEIVRQSTLQSVAPALIYEEANLIKRSIRDLYKSHFESILVQGDEGYRIAKKFMRTMMPSRAKLVQPYRDKTTLFRQYKVEEQLDHMHEPVVGLPAGGYLVINLTEALVAVDVNSGSSTRERTIEETALRTNLEAADAIARHMKLRDLAGLVVVDFIDMAEARNNRAVERRFREAFSTDRARVQMGRISVFGLLEFSRQRLRPSLLEVSSVTCLRCGGSGRNRSTESLVMQALRELEQEGLKGNKTPVEVMLPREAAMYLLNSKRQSLFELEHEYEMQVIVVEQKPDEPGSIVISPAGGGGIEVVANLQPASVRGAESKTRSRHQPIKEDGQKDKSQDVTSPVAKSSSASPAVVAGELSGIDDATSSARGRPRRRGRRGGKRRSVATRPAGSDQAQHNGHVENQEPAREGNVVDGGKEGAVSTTKVGQSATGSGNGDVAPVGENSPVVTSPETLDKPTMGSGGKMVVVPADGSTSKPAPRAKRGTGTRRRASTALKAKGKSDGDPKRVGEAIEPSPVSRRRGASSPKAKQGLSSGTDQTVDTASGVSGVVDSPSPGSSSQTGQRRSFRGRSSGEVSKDSMGEQKKNVAVGAMTESEKARAKDKPETPVKNSRRKGWWQRVTGSA
jgi:ribonuclease E